jgi:hypothetical protein
VRIVVLQAEYPRGLDLRPDDFAWMTEQIMGVANLCCEGNYYYY